MLLEVNGVCTRYAYRLLRITVLLIVTVGVGKLSAFQGFPHIA